MFGERVQRLRQAAGLTQSELAAQAGVSRQLVGAVEAGRHLPRVDAAAGLARALGVDVETLLAPGPDAVAGVVGPVPEAGAPVRLGRVGERLVCAPVPAAGEGWDLADAVVGREGLEWLPGGRSGTVLVGCDPALGLASRLAADRGARLVAVSASTRAALAALGGGRAHAAVVHGRSAALPQAGLAVHRWQLACWRVGLAAPAGEPAGWWREALAGRRRVVQREAGAGSQEAYERGIAAAGGTRPDGPVAAGHVEAARWAGLAGLVAVTIEPAALATGLAFHPLEEHVAQLWVGEDHAGEPGVAALGEVLTAAAFRKRLEAVGGYDLSGIGRAVAA